MPPWWNCPRARRRSTLPMPCTPASGTAAGARAWTGPSCRLTRRCKTGRRWRSPPSRKAAPRATGSTPSWATWSATAPRPRCAPASTPTPPTKPTPPAAGPTAGWASRVSPRARARVRAGFTPRATHETMARGREAVEKLLQREGKTALKLDDLAAQLGFKSADALFEVVGKDEFSLRSIEAVLRPPEPAPPPSAQLLHKKTRSHDPPRKDGVLV